MALTRYQIEEEIKTEIKELHESVVDLFSKGLVEILDKYHLSSHNEDVRNSLVRLVGYDLLDSFDDWSNPNG